jgi:RNA polymerase sigma factor (sigma-70 family)
LTEKRTRDEHPARSCRLIPDAQRSLELLFRVGAVGHLSDAELLELFLHRRDAAEAAFNVLVERHGPSVLRACRRVLLDPNDAHDAFQATFLTLVRKARSVRKRESVGSWLVGVALRSARRARVEAAKRRTRERVGAVRADCATSNAGAAVAEAEGCPELLEEIGRLPEVFRRPVVLCYLEGRSTEEAARRLGCPRGTILSRLARARDRLRTRLLHRGISLGLMIRPGAAPPAWLRNPVPEALCRATVEAALAVLDLPGAGRTVPLRIARLARGAATAAWICGGTVAIAVAFVLGLVLLQQPRRQDQPKPAPGTVALGASFHDGQAVPVGVPGAATKLPPALALQPDGSILVLTTEGRFGDNPTRYLVIRYGADGQLDPRFGDRGSAVVRFVADGIVTVPPARPRIAVQPDGKIVVAAVAPVGPRGLPNLGFQRFRADGTPDPDFGDGGTVVLDVGLPTPGGGQHESSDMLTGLALQPDGKIVAGGSAHGLPTVGQVFAMVRLLPDGSPDPAFGDGGRATTGFPLIHDALPPSDAAARDLALAPDGRIALVGHCRGASGRMLLAICLYDADGRLDRDFADGGRLALDIATRLRDAQGLEAGAATFTPEGALLVAGSAWTPAGPRLVLLRFDLSGRLDPKFGAGGVTLAAPGHARAIALQPDGKVLVGGSAIRVRDPERDRYRLEYDVSDFGLFRFLPGGAPDARFGVAGLIRSSLGEEDAIEALALAPDGSILTLGQALWGSTGLKVTQFLARHREP